MPGIEEAPRAVCTEGTESRQREQQAKCSQPEDTWSIWAPSVSGVAQGLRWGGDRSVRAQGWRGRWGQVERALNAWLRPGDARPPYRTHLLLQTHLLQEGDVCPQRGGHSTSQERWQRDGGQRPRRVGLEEEGGFQSLSRSVRIAQRVGAHPSG